MIFFEKERYVVGYGHLLESNKKRDLCCTKMQKSLVSNNIYRGLAQDVDICHIRLPHANYSLILVPL